ncbi:MAG: RDD family protein [Cytophagaceae bacterium]
MNEEVKIADKGTRFLNYLIDLLAICVLFIVIGMVLSFMIGINYIPIVFQIIYYVYYFCLEFKYNKTLGKMATGCVVVKKTGGKPSLGNLVIRTALRIAPLDAFSYLFGSEIGIHDRLSNTRVVKKKGVL